MCIWMHEQIDIREEMMFSFYPTAVFASFVIFCLRKRETVKDTKRSTNYNNLTQKSIRGKLIKIKSIEGMIYVVEYFLTIYIYINI